MACTYNLFTLLGGMPDANGTWNLTTIASGAGSSTLNVDGTSGTYSVGNQVGTNDSPQLVFDNTSTDTYTFTYTAGGTGTCSDTATVTIEVVEGVTAGVDATITKCDDDNTNYQLFDLIKGGDGTGTGTGTVSTSNDVTEWSWTGSTADPGYNAGLSTDATDDTFNPNNSSPGVYTFTYDITVNSTDGDCDNCSDNSIVTITVNAVANAGNNNSITVCNQV